VIWLVEMTVSGFKSLDGATVTFEKTGCTALVGPNNSGKSSILRALQLFFEEKAVMTEDERAKDTGAPSIECIFESDEAVTLNTLYAAGSEIVVARALAGERLYSVGPESRTAMKQPGLVAGVLPAFVYLKPERLPYQFNFSNPQSTTAAILVRKFGLQSPAATAARYSQESQTKRQIEQTLQQIWKATKSGRFGYIPGGAVMSLIIADEKERDFALADVGSGLQRATSIAVQMQDARSSAGKRSMVVTVDEPENSLHPSAQRDLLSYFRSRDSTQVVYATHSPAMIDTANPKSIRTLTYDMDTGRSRILDRKHLFDNYETIRLALGILPTDSLSTGFVNVVVEGAIELLVLPIWAGKLSDAAHLKLDLNLVRFLNGSGSSVPVYFDVAISTGMPTIAVLDNDPAGRAYAKRIESRTLSRYELDYKAVHHVIQGDRDTDLESTMPSVRLVTAINEICRPATKIQEADLTAQPAVKRSKNIEDFLKKQKIELDEFKTDIATAVARAMEPEEIPAAIAEVFRVVSGLLDRKQHLASRRKE